MNSWQSVDKIVRLDAHFRIIGVRVQSLIRVSVKV
jgi:hypothetical protein